VVGSKLGEVFHWAAYYKNHDITHCVLEPSFLAKAPSWNTNVVGSVLRWQHLMVSSHLLVAESMKSILKEKVMLRGGCNNAAYAIKCSC
jgi:hypothetical protein